MKSILKIFLSLTICCFVLQSCSKEDETPISNIEEKGEVSFSFDIVNKVGAKSSVNEKFSKSEQLNEIPNKIVVTIKSLEDGSIVYDKEAIDVIAFNGNYISDPIALETGNYELTEYFVLDKNENTIYLTPIEGSALAYLVNDPLVIDFSVEKDDSIQIAPEVVSPIGLEAEDFGYTDFSFDIVTTIDFLISAHFFDEVTESYELTFANVQILGDGTEVYNNSIDDVTQQIRVRDEYTSYTITTSKEGYHDDVQVFTNSELQAYINDPLIVLLSPINIETYEVSAFDNSLVAEGLFVGTYEVGETIVITIDANDTWNLGDNDPAFEVNYQGGVPIDPTGVYNNGTQGFLFGTLVGSFDNGLTFFKIETDVEETLTITSDLKLYCWDSDFENNLGSIEVSIEVLP